MGKARVRDAASALSLHVDTETMPDGHCRYIFTDERGKAIGERVGAKAAMQFLGEVKSGRLPVELSSKTWMTTAMADYLCERGPYPAEDFARAKEIWKKADEWVTARG